MQCPAGNFNMNLLKATLTREDFFQHIPAEFQGSTKGLIIIKSKPKKYEMGEWKGYLPINLGAKLEHYLKSQKLGGFARFAQVTLQGYELPKFKSNSQLQSSFFHRRSFFTLLDDQLEDELVFCVETFYPKNCRVFFL